MTEPSKAAVEKACEMLNMATANWSVENCQHNPIVVTLARFIDHVSEVAAGVDIRLTEAGYAPNSNTRMELSELILPDPEPDVLAEAIIDMTERLLLTDDQRAEHIQKYLAKRGYEIRKVQP